MHGVWCLVWNKSNLRESKYGYSRHSVDIFIDLHGSWWIDDSIRDGFDYTTTNRAGTNRINLRQPSRRRIRKFFDPFMEFNQCSIMCGVWRLVWNKSYFWQSKYGFSHDSVFLYLILYGAWRSGQPNGNRHSSLRPTTTCTSAIEH